MNKDAERLKEVLNVLLSHIDEDTESESYLTVAQEVFDNRPTALLPGDRYVIIAAKLKHPERPAGLPLVSDEYPMAQQIFDMVSIDAEARELKEVATEVKEKHNNDDEDDGA